MKYIVILITMLSVQFSFGQTEEFNKAAQNYVNGNIEVAKTQLEEALIKYPKDKKINALAEKVGVELKTETTVAKVEFVKPKVEPTKPVAVKDPKTEATKALLYQNANGKFDIDIENGEKLVCMFSLTCGHCQDAYKDLCAMSKQGNLPKMYLYCFGQEFEQNYFFKQAGDNCKDDYVRTENYADFTRLLEGESFPRILAFKNGKIVKSWNIRTYNENAVREFYGIAKPVEKKPGGVLNEPIEDNGGWQPGGGNPWD